MGKRSEFVRIERDFYPTPLAAVKPLFPHLPDHYDFVEPCAGDGRLVTHITENTKGRCTYASDIEPLGPSVAQMDALDLSEKHIGIDSLIITNPPWTRTKASGYLLHTMIEHFASLAPTWLLFDADWAHTVQSKPYMQYCRSIVSIGRVKWIEDSTMSGKDNCAWHHFDNTRTGKGPTVFYGR